MSNPFLIWCGAATDPSGYGEATRNYIQGLSKSDDIDLKLMNRSFWHGKKLDLRGQIELIDELSRKKIPQDREDLGVLFNLTPENYFVTKNVKTYIGMTTFETNGFPPFWAIPMRAMDAIITFTQFNKETFSEMGINRPIYVVPHGVDTVRFNPEVKPMKAIVEAKKDRFVFGSNFEWINRKNPQSLLKAYYKAFTKQDNVVLVIKSFHQFPIQMSADTIRNEIASIKREFGKGENTPPIILLTEMVKPEDISSFYTSLDCYVSPSRGEGWGLTYSEAMSCGLPTIGTNWSGNTEFMDDTNSILVDARVERIKQVDIEHQPHYSGQSWASIDEDKLADSMRYVYENQQEAKILGEKARSDMCEKWTWDAACGKLNDVLKDILG